jgi:hypothetical protein
MIRSVRSRSMPRVFCATAVFSMLVLPCRGQEAAAKPELLIRLSVAPARAPEPALKYLLLPELREINPGNPIQGYLKCYLEQYRFVFDEEEFDRRKTLLAMPLDELPAPQSPEFGRFALAQLDTAARLDNPDWQILLRLKADGFGTLLPDVQAMRPLGRALAVRFRAEIAAGRFDDAIRTAATMFAMARHLGEHPTYIGSLVGIAIAAIAINPLEEMLEQPGCPNLYWALTNLPDPLVSMKTGMEGERLTIWGFTRELYRTTPMSAEQIKKFIDLNDKLISASSPNTVNGGLKGYLAARTKDAQKLAAARKRLVDSGLPEASVKTFPPDQVILLDEERELRARFDELAKTLILPARIFEALYEKASAAKRAPAIFADAFLPFHQGARRAQARIEQRIALLRHIEALRLYAAENGGGFPASLSDVSVPLPDDPFTGKPFRYEASGKTAHLRGTPPNASENNRFFRVHYEITLKN